MGRPRKRALFPIALSPSATADALSIPVRRVREAIAGGELEAFDGGGKRIRILVPAILQWVRTWPKYSKRRS